MQPSQTPIFEIVAREDFSDATYLLEIRHPRMAKAARPGQFVIVMAQRTASASRSRSPTSTSHEGTITLVIQAVGKTTRKCASAARWARDLHALVGSDGHPEPVGEREEGGCVGGGLGVAPVFPQARAYKEAGAYVIGVLGFRSWDLVFWKDKFQRGCDELILCTNDGSVGIRGLVTDGLKSALAKHPGHRRGGRHRSAGHDEGVRRRDARAAIKTMVSLNPIMVDGTGMCGGCRVQVGGKVKFACVDGPDFDGHQVDFDDLMVRLARYKSQEAEALKRWSDTCRSPSRREPALVAARSLRGGAGWHKSTVRTIPQARTPMREQDAKARGKNFSEVACGYSARKTRCARRSAASSARTGVHRRLPGEHRHPGIHPPDRRQG